MTCPQLMSAGAYALGTLEPEEQQRFAAHLQACPACAEAAADFAILPEWLDKIDRDAAAVTWAPPSESGFRRLAATAAARRRSMRRRWALSAAAAALVAVLAGTLVVWHGDGAPAPTSVSASAGSVQARVTVQASDTGSRLALRLRGVPSGERCRLVAVAADGHRETAASWQATYAGTASIDGTTAIPFASLTNLVVETLDGRLLVRLALPPTESG